MPVFGGDVALEAVLPGVHLVQMQRAEFGVVQDGVAGAFGGGGIRCGGNRFDLMRDLDEFESRLGEDVPRGFTMGHGMVEAGARALELSGRFSSEDVPREEEAAVAAADWAASSMMASWTARSSVGVGATIWSSTTRSFFPSRAILIIMSTKLRPPLSLQPAMPKRPQERTTWPTVGAWVRAMQSPP